MGLIARLRAAWCVLRHGYPEVVFSPAPGHSYKLPNFCIKGPIFEPPANPFEGDREQARAMGLCRECGDGRYGHTYTVLCWWMRRWQQKDATW